jgi:hypothetical protein
VALSGLKGFGILDRLTRQLLEILSWFRNASRLGDLLFLELLLQCQPWLPPVWQVTFHRQERGSRGRISLPDWLMERDFLPNLDKFLLGGILQQSYDFFFGSNLHSS